MNKIPKRVPEIQVSYSFKVAVRDRPKILTSEDSFEVFCEIWDKDIIAYQESIFALFLNGANRLLGYRCLSNGASNYTIMDAKHLFGIAVKCNVRSIVIGHNHPSGLIFPSDHDRKLTTKLFEGGKILDIMLLDHLIITPTLDTYYSFADEGYLQV
ncbi:MAG: JAB domain-containing protein [Bacteroidota bacterium]